MREIAASMASNMVGEDMVYPMQKGSRLLNIYRTFCSTGISNCKGNIVKQHDIRLFAFKVHLSFLQRQISLEMMQLFSSQWLSTGFRHLGWNFLPYVKHA